MCLTNWIVTCSNRLFAWQFQTFFILQTITFTITWLWPTNIINTFQRWRTVINLMFVASSSIAWSWRLTDFGTRSFDVNFETFPTITSVTMTTIWMLITLSSGQANVLETSWVSGLARHFFIAIKAFTLVLKSLHWMFDLKKMYLSLTLAHNSWLVCWQPSVSTQCVMVLLTFEKT